MDALCEHDQYSAYMDAAYMDTQSWIASTPDCVPTAVSRAGNVVGGGDVSPERLMVDLLAAAAEGRPARLRNPSAVRPWQHVLDCLDGYLALVGALLDGRGAGQAYNFGPPPTSSLTVGDIADRVVQRWDGGAAWQDDSSGVHPAEAELLTLDSQKAAAELGWRSVLTLDETLDLTVGWARRVAAGEDPQQVALDQVEVFAGLAGRRR